MNTKHFTIRLSLCNSLSVEDQITTLRHILDNFLAEQEVEVHSISWDADLAAQHTKNTTNLYEVLGIATAAELSADAIQVAAYYNIILPKPTRGSPPWRVPQGEVWGQPRGLHRMYGKLILTNGIHAFIVNHHNQWAKIMYNNFIPDEDLQESGLPPQTTKTTFNAVFDNIEEEVES